MQVFAWKSAYDIREVVIPTLSELLEEQYRLYAQYVAARKTKFLADVSKRIERLSGAIAGWNSVLDRVQDLYDTAETSKTILPIKNLVSEQLLVGDDGKDQVSYINGSRAANANVIRDISGISFVGGGATMAYTEQETIESTKTKGTGASSEMNVGDLFTVELTIAVVTINEAYSEGTITSKESSLQTGTATTTDSARGFALGDPDVGDSFDIKVFRDPVYQTPFFITKSGRSKSVDCDMLLHLMIHRCPWEENTARREGAIMLYKEGDGLKNQILPESPAVFEA